MGYRCKPSLWLNTSGLPWVSFSRCQSSLCCLPLSTGHKLLPVKEREELPVHPWSCGWTQSPQQVVQCWWRPWIRGVQGCGSAVHLFPRGTFLTLCLGLRLGHRQAGGWQLLSPSVPLELCLFAVSQPESRLNEPPRERCGYIWCILEGFDSGVLQCFSIGRRTYFLHLWHHLLTWPVPWDRSKGTVRPKGRWLGW